MRRHCTRVSRDFKHPIFDAEASESLDTTTNDPNHTVYIRYKQSYLVFTQRYVHRTDTINNLYSNRRSIICNVPYARASLFRLQKYHKYLTMKSTINSTRPTTNNPGNSFTCSVSFRARRLGPLSYPETFFSFHHGTRHTRLRYGFRR